jgi:glycosyltransferase involved in cell wall biosynthesis
VTDERDQQKLALIQGRLQCIGQKNVQFVSLFGKNRFLWNLLSVPWFLMNHPVDVYHTQYILPLFVPKRTQVVLHIHDVSFRAYQNLIGWMDRLFLSLFIPHALSRANGIVTPSLFTKQEIRVYYGTAPEKIHVIANALGSNFLTPVKGNPLSVREKYHLPERYLLSVGTLQPRKNIPFLIRAFAQLRRRIPDIHLVIVGNRRAHHFDNGIDTAIRELKLEAYVHFPGFVEEHDLPVIYSAAIVFVFPSLYEGFGIPLLEAMSQKVPIAASDTPCLREVAGNGALYFDPTSIAICEEKLYTLLTDKEQREVILLSAEGRLALYSWEKSAAALLSLYEVLPK